MWWTSARRRTIGSTRSRPKDLRKVLRLIRNDGPLTIRDIDDDVLVEKEHLWASRKPSKRALQLAFYTGVLDGQRTHRHAQDLRADGAAFRLEGAAAAGDASGRSRAICSTGRCARRGSSASTRSPPRGPAQAGDAALIEARVRRRELMPVTLEGAGKPALDAGRRCRTAPRSAAELVHILSPFDPLIIQRSACSCSSATSTASRPMCRRRSAKLGYFALPVLVGDEIVARSISRPTGRAASCCPEVDLGRRPARRAGSADRGGAAPLRAVPVRGVSGTRSARFR